MRIASDEEVKQDGLGLNDYYNGLGDFILNCDTPMTISIQGKWGSGKTSIFYIIKENVLDEKIKSGEVLFVPFDTWMYTKSLAKDNLTFVLLDQLLHSFAELAPSKKPTIGQFIINIIKRIMSLFVGIITGILSFFAERYVGEGFADKIKDGIKGIKNVKEQLNEAESLLQLRTTLAEMIEEYCGEENKRIVVFVDDLDRLDPVVAVELLEGIKNFMDCKHCVFVLAIDDSVVYEGVYKKYGLDRDNEEHRQKAHSFFDKIIQVPFSMPYGVYRIDEYIKQWLIDEEEPIRVMYKTLIELYINDNNPREIKRVFNLYELNKLILLKDKEVTQQENICLFLITLIQIKENNYYLKLISGLQSLETILDEDDEEFPDNQERLNHALIMISEMLIQDEDDFNHKKKELIKLIGHLFAINDAMNDENIKQESSDPFNNVKDMLYNAQVMSGKIDNNIDLFTYGNDKLCRFKKNEEDDYNITIYGAENLALIKDLTAEFKEQLKKSKTYITLSNVNSSQTALVEKIFERIISQLHKEK